MKKIGTWIFGILGVLYLIGVIFGGGNESSTSEDSVVMNKSYTSESSATKKHQEVLAKKYTDLPIKQNLSYFVSIKNIAGLVISRIDNSPLSAYETGLEFGSDRNIREENLQKAFNIDRYRVNAVVTAKINAKGFSEFEIDDFEKKLKEEFAKTIQPIRDAYKNVDKHIRIVNLNIPVKYSKESKAVASIKITDIASLQKLNYSKPMLLSDFIKEELNNKYISQYIIPSKEKYNFETIIEYEDDSWTGGFDLEGDPNILNKLGKFNKGKDIITELTLHVFYSQYGNPHNPHETHFVITSFKLKSSDKRFISNYYINKIVTAQSFGNTYFIKSDDVNISMKEDD